MTTTTPLPALALPDGPIRPGEAVTVTRSAPRKRDTYTGRVMAIREVTTPCPACAGSGAERRVEVDVCGPRGWRVVPASRIRPAKAKEARK